MQKLKRELNIKIGSIRINNSKYNAFLDLYTHIAFICNTFLVNKYSNDGNVKKFQLISVI